ncbi:hypothetical protein JOE55_000920 [Kocuria palustris]|nr:hypothetical protein [Kocuria palustris]
MLLAIEIFYLVLLALAVVTIGLISVVVVKNLYKGQM